MKALIKMWLWTAVLVLPSMAHAQWFEVYNDYYSSYLNGPGPTGGTNSFGSNGMSGNCSAPVTTSNVTVSGAPTYVPPYGTFRVNYSISYSTPGSFYGTYRITCGQMVFGANISGTYVKPVTVRPLYKIISVLYDPPGDASSNGYNNTTSAGTTTSTESDFSSTDTVTYSYNGGILGIFNNGGSVSFSVGVKTANTSSFETDYSSSTGYDLNSAEQNIDHTQDQFFLWLNPETTYYQSGATSSYYTVENAGNGQNMDIVNVNAAGLANPSLIPLQVLETQVPKPGVSLPGLKNICAHPLPDNQCTQANACGCVPSDFAAILNEDPLIGSSQTTPPSTINSNRYVYVNYVTLQGPAQKGGGTVKETFNQTDSTLQSYTNSLTHIYKTAFQVGWGWGVQDAGTGFNMTVTDQNEFEWDETQSYGTSNGKAHTATVTMGSDKVGCYEYVDVYEDTVYHTYSFALPSTPPQPCQ